MNPCNLSHRDILLKIFNYTPVFKETFAANMNIARMVINAPGAPFINNSVTCNYTIIPGKSRTISLDQDASTLANNPGNYQSQNPENVTYSLNGSRLYYFGARYYDPEIGRWSSVDPKGQFFDGYQYGTNPINFVDPNGEWIKALFSAAQWYIGSSISQGSLNPLQWDWSDLNLWFSTLNATAVVGTDLSNDFNKLAYSRSLEGRGLGIKGDYNLDGLHGKGDLSRTNNRTINDALIKERSVYYLWKNPKYNNDCLNYAMTLGTGEIRDANTDWIPKGGHFIDNFKSYGLIRNLNSYSLAMWNLKPEYITYDAAGNILESGHAGIVKGNVLYHRLADMPSVEKFDVFNRSMIQTKMYNPVIFFEF